MLQLLGFLVNTFDSLRITLALCLFWPLDIGSEVVTGEAVSSWQTAQQLVMQPQPCSYRSHQDWGWECAVGIGIGVSILWESGLGLQLSANIHGLVCMRVQFQSLPLLSAPFPKPPKVKGGKESDWYLKFERWLWITSLNESVGQCLHLLFSFSQFPQTLKTPSDFRNVSFHFLKDEDEDPEPEKKADLDRPSQMAHPIAERLDILLSLLLSYIEDVCRVDGNN